MNLRKIILPLLLSLAGVAGATLLLMSPPRTSGEGHEEGGAEEPRGPNRGRLLQDGDFTLELAISEADGPPEFRAWFTKAGRPVAASEVRLSVAVRRPDGVQERFSFAPKDGFVRGDREVAEPHSFDIEAQAEHAGVTHRWAFAAPEMRTTLDARTAENSGVRVARAAAAEMLASVEVYGRIGLDQDSVRRASSRFNGVVREFRKSVGDKVAAADVVARVENIQTLVVADVVSPGSGTVIARGVSVGDAVSEGVVLFSVADLGHVWLDLEIPRSELTRVRSGQAVSVRLQEGGEPASAQIAFVSPLMSADNQTASARVVLANVDGRWKPGAFVRASVAVDAFRVPVAVKESAVQTMDGRTVVFSRHGDVYQGRPVQLGRRSGGLVEVVKGLGAGETYVSEGSFLIKADIAKSGASHDH